MFLSHIFSFLLDATLFTIDPSLSAALESKQASQSVASATSDQGLTFARLCSVETHAIFSEFRHFQARSVDFELVVVKHCVWGTFVCDTCPKKIYALYLSKIKR